MIYMRKHIIFFVTAGVIMLLLPFVLVKFVSSESMMIICLLLLFGINPIYSVISGIFSGGNIREFFYVPIETAVLFILGAFLFFGMDKSAFIGYAAVYLVIGGIAMVVAGVVSRSRNGRC